MYQCENKAYKVEQNVFFKTALLGFQAYNSSFVSKEGLRTLYLSKASC